MILAAHVIIALLSLAYGTVVFFFPSNAKLHALYGLVGATLASGSYLVWSNPAHLAQACTSGLIYLGAVAVAIVAARHKLAATGSSEID